MKQAAFAQLLEASDGYDWRLSTRSSLSQKKLVDK